MTPPEKPRDTIVARYLETVHYILLKDERMFAYSQLLEISRANILEDLAFLFAGYLQWLKGEYDYAIQNFLKSLAVNDNLAYPWLGLGNVYADQKEYTKAEEAFRKAITLDENIAYPWHGLGNVYADRKEYTKAEETFRKAITLDEKFSYPWQGLGNVYADQKEYTKAEEAFRKAITIDEKNASSWNGLGNVYADQKEYTKAEEAFRKAITLDEKNASSWNGLGNMHFAQKEYEKAEEAFRKAITLDEKNASSWNGLGNMYFAQKEYAKAEETFCKAVTLDVKNVYSWNGLGKIYFAQKEYTKAEEAFRKAIKLDKSDYGFYYNLGLVIEKGDNLAEAKVCFALAKDYFRKNKNVYFSSLCENKLIDLERTIHQNDFLKGVIEKAGGKGKTTVTEKLLRLLGSTSNFEKEVFANQETFEVFVKGEATKDLSAIFLEVLRRWNSYTPIVADNYHTSKGGGYFLSVRGFGIVIDPGFNFIDNFKGAGHCFDEIDAVMITHAHNDHTSDLESIITLLNKCNRRRKGIDISEPETIRADLARSRECDINEIEPSEIEEAFYAGSPRRKRIDLYLTKSVLKKFGGMLNSTSKCDYRYHIIEKGEFKKLPNKIKIEVVEAKHDDVISDQDSVGFVFNFDGTTLIYTGDTGWDESIENQYRRIGRLYKKNHIILLAHLGGFKREENDYAESQPENRKNAFYKNHLGRLGLGMLVDVVKPKVCMISEFGEELRRYRTELTDIFSEIWDNGTVFLAADIGLKYDLVEKKVYGIKGLDASECTRGWISPDSVATCLLYKDYSLHYYDNQPSIDEGELQHVLGEEFERSLGRKRAK